MGTIGGGTLSDVDIYEPPEPFEVSLQEAIQMIWVKLGQLEQGMRPAGTPVQDSCPSEPWDSTRPASPPGARRRPPGHLHPRDPHSGHPFPGDTPRDFMPGLDRAEPLQLVTGMRTPCDPQFNDASPNQLLPASPPAVSASPVLPRPRPHLPLLPPGTAEFLPPRAPAGRPRLPVRDLPPRGLPVPCRLPRWGRGGRDIATQAVCLPVSAASTGSRTGVQPLLQVRERRWAQLAMLPVQDVWVHEDEAITLHCDVPFAVPPELQVTWMFAKDVSSMHVQCAQTSGGSGHGGIAACVPGSSAAGCGGHCLYMIWMCALQAASVRAHRAGTSEHPHGG